jgi:hypothetical protein
MAQTLEGQKFSEDKIPLYTFLMQFKHALIEVAKCSQAGHNKYPNDVDWQNFKRVDNPDFQYKNAAIRHLFEEGVNKDMLKYGTITHEAQVIWNLLAALETKILSQEKLS